MMPGCRSTISAGQVDAVDGGQPDVHQHDVRLGLVDDPERGLAVVSLSDHGEPAGIVQDASGAGPEQLVIVDDHHPSDRRWDD